MIYNAYQNNNKELCGISIVSSGHIFAQKNRQIHRPNGRTDYLLFYVAKGSNHFLLENETVLNEGSFILFRPFEKQCHIQKDNAMSEFYYVHFNAHENFDLFNFKSSVAYHVKPSTKIRDLFEDIIDELQTKQPSYEKICVVKFLNILSLLERKCEKETNPEGHYADKISYVIQRMNKEYEKSISLDEYAQMCNMSKFHFLRVFKNIVGTTPIEYRNDIRLEHAKELLVDTDYSIDEICRRVGYTSNAYFCDVFKKRFAKAPSQFRKDIM